MEAITAVGIGDLNLAYRSVSTAPGTPVVFVHGLGEDSRSWRAQMRELGTSRPVYAVDVRGHGSTDLGVANGTLDQLADDLVDFLTSVAGPSVCVGFSMGGAIVMAAAAKRSDLVTHGVVVCSSSVVGTRVAERFLTRADGIDHNGQEFAAEALRANLEATVLTKPPGWTSEVQDRIEAIGDGRGYANGARAMASMKTTPLTERLPLISSRIDVLVGEYDESCPWRAAEIIVDAVASGRAHRLAGVGHFVNIEDPQVLTKALQDLGL